MRKDRVEEVCEEERWGMGGGTIFFFQAEDGIRDYDVTGVQTCALPIWITGQLHSHAEGEPEGICGASQSEGAPSLCRWSQIGRASCRERV